VITIFLAGYEDRSQRAFVDVDVLSQTPECERRFHEEIDRELRGRLRRSMTFHGAYVEMCGGAMG